MSDAKTNYNQETNEIESLLTAIREQLERHQELFESGGNENWGYVGDLGRIRETLQEAYDSLNWLR